MSDFIGDKECVTHHYACECREKEFETKLAEKSAKIHALKKELKIQRENWSEDIDEFTIREKELKAEIERLKLKRHRYKFNWK